MADTKWTREIVPGTQYQISTTDRITIAEFDAANGVTIANMDDESLKTAWTQETLP